MLKDPVHLLRISKIKSKGSSLVICPIIFCSFPFCADGASDVNAIVGVIEVKLPVAIDDWLLPICR